METSLAGVTPHINIKRLVGNINRTNVYTPLVEAISNSIDAIELSKRKDKRIVITLKRSPQAKLGDRGDELSPITTVEIFDNGTGFNQENFDSFNTIYGEQKIKQGGKGFGRFTFLKYFEEVEVKSVYQDDKKYRIRSFEFTNQDNFIQNEKDMGSSEKDTRTVITLGNMREEHLDKLDKKPETVARKLLEMLLLYFALDDFQCPTISVKELDGKEIILNDYLAKNGLIQEIKNQSFILESEDKRHKEGFKIKIFKVFYGDSRSSINLVADKRQVTEEALYEYVPEFKDDFYEKIAKGKGKTEERNYTIKTYVFGRYLDLNVSLDRDGFLFQKEHNNNLLFPFSQKEIEKRAAQLTKDTFKEEVKTRQDRKIGRIKEYVNSRAPWHKAYFNELDLTSLPFDVNEAEIETELQKIKFQREQTTKKEIAEVLENDKFSFNEKLEKLVSRITEIGKSDLAHYVSNRKIVLDLFKKLLEREDSGKAKLEEEIHNAIFPMGKDSSNTDYEDHNLWLIDERLVFSEFVASDRKINKQSSKVEPDLVVFDKKIAFRGGDNEYSNPVTIFEFKRPKRENYTDSEDPIVQIGNYIKEIRAGKYELPRGSEKIKVNEYTPVYGYIICDITSRIKEFATRASLVLSPDNEGYFGFHPGYGMYIEIFSFSKLLKDANLRNKIFFQKLSIE